MLNIGVQVHLDNLLNFCFCPLFSLRNLVAQQPKQPTEPLFSRSYGPFSRTFLMEQISSSEPVVTLTTYQQSPQTHQQQLLRIKVLVSKSLCHHHGRECCKYAMWKKGDVCDSVQICYYSCIRQATKIQWLLWKSSQDHLINSMPICQQQQEILQTLWIMLYLFSQSNRSACHALFLRSFGWKLLSQGVRQWIYLNRF